MPDLFRFRFVFLTLFGLLLGSMPLTGCGVVTQSADATQILPGHLIRGNVHGGVYPIQNATVRLMETQTNGYGGAAKQLLQTTSDAGGFFTFPDTGWSCDSNQFAYITVTSGHTDTNATNNNVGQIGVIGNCGKVLSTVAQIDAVQVYVSELSTIAAAYALRGFITVDDTYAGAGGQIINISAPAANNAAAGACVYYTPTTCIAAGLAHGFENAYNLVDSVNFGGQLPSGAARTTTPTNQYGYVPQSLINTLANILQSCVDSPGGVVMNAATYLPGAPGSTHCGDLFFWATPPGGIAPTNTLEVALNMAQYPSNNAAQLYALQPRAVFFSPTLNTPPHDLSLSVFYLTQGFGAQSGNLVNPVALALDANDDAFIVATAAGNGNTQTAILGISTNGAVLFAGPVSNQYLNPSSIATDALNNIWVTNNSPGLNGAVLKVSPATGSITTGTLLPAAAGVAVDRQNNVWVSLNSLLTSSIERFNAGSLTGGTVNPALQQNLLGATLSGLNIDVNQNVWTVNNSGQPSAAVMLPNTGTATAPVYVNALLSKPLSGSAGTGGASNRTGQMFFPLNSRVDGALYQSGLTVNNKGSFSSSAYTFAQPQQSEVDGAGNVFWTDFEPAGMVYQFIPSADGTYNAGSLQAVMPCYPVNGACYLPAVANLRSMQVDSTGALWYLADGSFNGSPLGVVVQTMGFGAPTWPQLSLGAPGVRPQ